MDRLKPAPTEVSGKLELFGLKQFHGFVDKLSSQLTVNRKGLSGYLSTHSVYDLQALTSFVGAKAEYQLFEIRGLADMVLTGAGRYTIPISLNSEDALKKPSEEYLKMLEVTPSQPADAALEIIETTQLLGQAAKLKALLQSGIKIPGLAKLVNRLIGSNESDLIEEANERLTSRVPFSKVEKRLLFLAACATILGACAPFIAQGAGNSSGNELPIHGTPPATHPAVGTPSPNSTYVASPPTSSAPPTKEAPEDRFCGIDSQQVIASEGFDEYSTVPVASNEGFIQVFGFNPQATYPDNSVEHEILAGLTSTVSSQIARIITDGSEFDISTVIIPQYIRTGDVNRSVREEIRSDEIPFEIRHYQSGIKPSQSTLLLTVQAGEESWTVGKWTKASIADNPQGRKEVIGMLVDFDDEEGGNGKLKVIPGQQYSPDGQYVHAGVALVDSCSPEVVIIGPAGEAIAVLNPQVNFSDLNNLWDQIDEKINPQPSPTLKASATAQSTLPPVDVLPEMKIRETYVFKIGDTLESIASNFGITTRELLLVNNNIRWEHDGLDGFELKIPEKLSDQNLNMFYEIDFKLAPDLQGYSKNRDNEHRFVFYINKETGKTDRVMDLQTSKIYGYAKAKDNTVLLTDEVLLQEKGLLYPGYYDHGGTLDKAVETWKDQQIKSRNPYGLSKDTSIEIEVRFSDPDTPWGQQKITNYSDGTFFGIWYAWTKNGSFRLITYVSSNNEAFVGFIFRTLQYTTPNRITLADKWLAKLNINPGYPEYDIEIGYRPPGKIITEETYPIGIKK